jgi:hypothetical protein
MVKLFYHCAALRDKAIWVPRNRILHKRDHSVTTRPQKYQDMK